LQQPAAGDVAVAVLMHAAKVAIKRRYFIRSSFFDLLRNTAANLNRAEPTLRRNRCAAVELADARHVLSRARQWHQWFPTRAYL